MVQTVTPQGSGQSEMLRASNKMTRGRDGVNFAAGRGAWATAHKGSDARSLSDTGMQPKTPRPSGLRLGPASAVSGRLAVPDPGTASSPFLASIRPEAQRGSRGILLEALRATQRPRSGFTLVELMVAVALALILMSVVMLVFSQSLGVFRRAQATTEAIHSAQVALDFLGKDIEGAEATKMIFLGVQTNTATCWVDSNHNGVNDDPVAFDNTTDPPNHRWERHGLEFVTMSLYSFDEAGQPVPDVHVLYYVGWDPATKGRLIRCTRKHSLDTDPVTRFIANSLKDLDLPAEDSQEIAYGVEQFKVRYFYKGVWYPGWDSTNTAGYDTDPLATQDDFQYSTLPQLVEVQLTLVDSDGFMDKAGSNPIVIRRLIPVGTVVPFVP